MASRSKRIYAPGDFLDELAQIQHGDLIKSQAEAMRRMAKYAQLGRELQQQQTAFAIFSVRRGNNGRA